MDNAILNSNGDKRRYKKSEVYLLSITRIIVCLSFFIWWSSIEVLAANKNLTHEISKETSEIKRGVDSIQEDQIRPVPPIKHPLLPVVEIRPFGYRELQEDVVKLGKMHKGFAMQSIGKSASGADIMMIKLGTGDKKVFISGGWHGDEWISALFLTRHIESILLNRDSDMQWDELLKNVTLYIVPMVNPDGCEIAVHGTDVNSFLLDAIEKLRPPEFSLSSWRANAQGIDPNKQYPINWESLRYSLRNNPPPRGTAGEEPLRAPESQAIYQFTLANDIKAVFCYHTQGQVIYWDTYPTEETDMMRSVANEYAKVSNYSLIDDQSNFAGGYRDWFVVQYQRPGLTIEIGVGDNPLPLSDFEEIWQRNYMSLYKTLQVVASAH